MDFPENVDEHIAIQSHNLVMKALRGVEHLSPGDAAKALQCAQVMFEVTAKGLEIACSAAACGLSPSFLISSCQAAYDETLGREQHA